MSDPPTPLPRTLNVEPSPGGGFVFTEFTEARPTNDVGLLATDTDTSSSLAGLAKSKGIVVEPCVRVPPDMERVKQGDPRQAMRMLALKEGNDTCADCGASETTWASYTLGVFICRDCSGIHQNLDQVSQVKCLEDPWEEAEVKFMAQHGNIAAKSRYEAHVPVYYYQPMHRDCQVLREEWIRSKYEREEFTEPNKLSLCTDGLREGNLWKRGRDNRQFLIRRFVLSDREGTLKYFKTQDGKEPKCVIKIDSINASFQPTKIGNPNGLQITHRKDSRTRNIFLYHEDGKEIVNWFNAIRMAQFNYLKVAFPTAVNKEIVHRMTQNFIKEGYMEKTGPKQTEGFKKRWFTLDHRRLMYFKNPMDAFAKGEVFLGSTSHGYDVKKGLPVGTQGNFTWRHGITIVTPERCYLLTCESDKEQQSWVQALNDVLSKPMSPQDCAAEAYFRHRS
ncbi:arf-GAP with dual PH domain-containing protein 1-like [Ambystoma mexicanum]|uniref:arf-GAP with dual PH domain-containing protein 1-like n=1 Tax=Ambystoma mexicanum TaxID=8296 RepID=UPI0037E7DF0B